MRTKMIAAAALWASTLAFAVPAGAEVAPGDRFSLILLGFNQATGAAITLTDPITAKFGDTEVNPSAGIPDASGDQDVTVSSSETMDATTTTDSISVFVPRNFVPVGTTAITESGEHVPIDAIRFDFGEGNGGDDPLDFAQPITGMPTYSGSIVFNGDTTLTLNLDPTLFNGNSSLAFFEPLFSPMQGQSISDFAVSRFNFSITYATPVASSVPEPASWALMIAGFGAVGYAMRRAVRRSDARFEDRIRRITAGEIA